jgi:Isoprenylcysteine carboxyl methyltransferase (ICMT) family
VAKLKMLSISVAYLIVEFTLAILGWRGFLSFFTHPQFLALAILTVVLTAASLFSGASISSGVKEDRSNRWVIGALSLIGLLLAFFSSYTDRLGLLVFGGNTLRWVGVVLFTVGGVLRLWPVFVLGSRFSGLVAIQEHHTLVTDGIYSRIRKPKLSGLAGEHARMGAHLQIRCGSAPHSAHNSDPHCPHHLRGAASARTLRW